MTSVFFIRLRITLCSWIERQMTCLVLQLILFSVYQHLAGLVIFFSCFACVSISHDIFVIEANLWGFPRNLIENEKNTHYMREPTIINSPKTFESWNSNCKLKMCYKQWNIVSVYLIKYFTTMELLVFRKCFIVYVCMYACVWHAWLLFFPVAFTFWFRYLFICIYLYIHSIICRMRFVLNQFAFFQWIAFVYTCVRHWISIYGILYAQINGKTHTRSPHNYPVSLIPIFIHSFAISLIYYAQQIVYGHFGWLKTMSHNCPQRDRICVYFVSMSGFITFSLVV